MKRNTYKINIIISLYSKKVIYFEINSNQLDPELMHFKRTHFYNTPSDVTCFF